MQTTIQPLTFTRVWRQFKPGDPVPDAFDHGTRDALLQRGTVKAGEPTAADPVPFAPENKAVQPKRVKRK